MFQYSSYQHYYLMSGERFHASHHLVMRMAQFLVLLQGKRLERLPRERMETQAMLCDKLLTYVARSGVLRKSCGSFWFNIKTIA